MCDNEQETPYRKGKWLVVASTLYPKMLRVWYCCDLLTFYLKWKYFKVGKDWPQLSSLSYVGMGVPGFSGKQRLCKSMSLWKAERKTNKGLLGLGKGYWGCRSVKDPNCQMPIRKTQEIWSLDWEDPLE